MLSMLLQRMLWACVVVSIVTLRLHPNLPGVLMRPPTSNNPPPHVYWPLCSIPLCAPCSPHTPITLRSDMRLDVGRLIFKSMLSGPAHLERSKQAHQNRGSPSPTPRGYDQNKCTQRILTSERLSLNKLLPYSRFCKRWTKNWHIDLRYCMWSVSDVFACFFILRNFRMPSKSFWFRGGFHANYFERLLVSGSYPSKNWQKLKYETE